MCRKSHEERTFTNRRLNCFSLSCVQFCMAFCSSIFLKNVMAKKKKVMSMRFYDSLNIITEYMKRNFKDVLQ